MNVDKNILAEFKELTKFDIVAYYRSFIKFMNKDLAYITDYFSGETNIVKSSAFDDLNKLLIKSNDALSLFTQVKDELNNLKYADLMLQLEDIDNTLLTIKNISRWLRSPKTNISYEKIAEVQLGLAQQQTLESINKEILNNVNYQDSWMDTAIRNDLTEEDYTDEGGNLLSVSFSREKININSVVDNLAGDNLLGKDIDKKLQFVGDDLKVLNFKDTFKQSVLILSGLQKGDNPSLADLGVDVKQGLGTNIALINLPIMLRQLIANFATDDTITKFNIKDIERKSDGYFITFTVKTILGEFDIFNIKLNN